MTDEIPTSLRERARLTVETYGWGELLLRFVTAPLRLLGLEKGVRDRLRERRELKATLLWYMTDGRPVTIVMPTYGAPDITFDAVKALRRTVDAKRVRIVVVDDASAPEHQERLKELRGVELVLAPENGGYSASVNLGLERAGDGDDVVVMNSDVIAGRHWLPRLQEAAYDGDATGIVGPRLLYPDGRIQSAGSYRNMDAPEWFDHRYRFRPADHPQALVDADAIAVTGACMYLRRDLIDAIGGFDDGYPMGYEDVDYCLRSWEEGRAVRYEPTSKLTHMESPTRGTDVGDRERVSQERFWGRWGSWFDERPVRTADGGLRIIYVTEDTGVGGGHRDIFEHLNRLAARGHSVELFSLEGAPDWFPLECNVRAFEDFEEVALALAEENAIKVATWWGTGPAVWRGSVRRGRPVFFVQDIETSYYGTDDHRAVLSRRQVLAGYREEFAYVTISRHSQKALKEMGREAELIPPGIDLDNFRQLGTPRSDDTILALGRTSHLKNFPLTVAAWERLDPRPPLKLFGVEPEAAEGLDAEYVYGPSDSEVNELFNEAAVFVQTSRHEGFCLPPLEAMAAGAPVVCTDAHGNRDFCIDGENCLMVEAEPAAVAAGLERVLGDAALRDKLVAGGLATVGEYAWKRRIDQMEDFFARVADQEPPAPSGALPEPRANHA